MAIIKDLCQLGNDSLTKGKQNIGKIICSSYAAGLPRDHNGEADLNLVDSALIVSNEKKHIIAFR
jgi:hypothetical protein